MAHPFEMTTPIPVENRYTKRLEERGFEVSVGFDQEVIEALHKGISDPVITASTNDARRFASPEKVIEWHEKSPKVVYSLVDSAIRGVIWFGDKTSPYSTAESTFAIRMYDGARGLHLADDFLEAAHTDFIEHQGGGDVWLRVKRDNPSAKNLYLRHGYQISHQTRLYQTMTRRVR